jgi:hypothetical protein
MVLKVYLPFFPCQHHLAISVSKIRAIPVNFSSDGLFNLGLGPSSRVPKVQNIKLCILETVTLLPSSKGCETPTHTGTLDDAILNLWTYPSFYLWTATIPVSEML